MHVLRGLQHLLHPVRQGWVLSRVAGAAGVNIVLQRGGWRGGAARLWTGCAWGRSWGRGAASSPATSTPPRVSAGGIYSVEAGVDIVPPRLPHLARLPGPGAGGPPGAAPGQGLREQDSGRTVPEDLLLQVGMKAIMLL